MKENERIVFLWSQVYFFQHTCSQHKYQSPKPDLRKHLLPDDKKAINIVHDQGLVTVYYNWRHMIHRGDLAIFQTSPVCHLSFSSGRGGGISILTAPKKEVEKCLMCFITESQRDIDNVKNVLSGIQVLYKLVF